MDRSALRPYAFGWFQLDDSDALKRRDVRPFQAFGQEFVLWRDEQGHRPRPRLARGDGPVMTFRQWASQFAVDHEADASPELHRPFDSPGCPRPITETACVLHR